MRLVVLGTGTDVGKTYVTVQLARSLVERVSVLALKPIESGASPSDLQHGDAGAIAAAAQHPPRLSPWRFQRPVSPHLAARQEGRSIEVEQVARWVEAEEAAHPTAVSLVELAGGAFSPLAMGKTNVDLALALEPALWLLVAPDGLGVLHDVTATLRALPRRPDALVLAASRLADASTGSNAAELAALGIAEVLEVVGRDASACPVTRDWLLGDPSFMSSPT